MTLHQLSIGFALLTALVAVETVDAAPLIDGRYYEDAVTRPCSTGDSNYCFLDFSPIPSGKSVLLHRVGCVVTTPNTPIRFFLWAVRPNGSLALNRQEELNMLTVQTAGAFITSFDSEVEFLYRERHRPRVGIAFAEPTDAIHQPFCRLVGEILRGGSDD